MGDVIATATLAAHGIALHLVQTENPKHTAASAIWIDGVAVSPSRTMRLHQAWMSVVGGRRPPVMIAVVPDPDPSGENGDYARARVSIESWLKGQSNLNRSISLLSRSK